MTDHSELKRLAAAIESCTSIPEEDEAAWMRRTTGRAVGELLEELQNLRTDNAQLIYALKQQEQSYLVLRAERDQLKAEVEALRQALRDVMTQVDGNIRETVRDCVNGHNDVQDIYGYCDTIEGLIDAAVSKGSGHD